MTRRLRGAVLLVCALAAAPAHAVPSCTVATGAVLSFGPVVALASSADADANTGVSLWVNCSGDVEDAPRLYSGSERTLVGVGEVWTIAPLLLAVAIVLAAISSLVTLNRYTKV